MEISNILLLVFLSAFTVNADKFNLDGERSWIEEWVRGRYVHDLNTNVVGCLFNSIFSDSPGVFEGFRDTRHTRCFIRYLMIYRPVGNMIVEYMYKGDDQPGKAELKKDLTKAITAVNTLCSKKANDARDFGFQIIQLSEYNEADNMLLKCIFDYGTDKGLINDRIFEAIHWEESKECRRYEKTVERIVRIKPKDEEMFCFDSELDRCVYQKDRALESINQNAILVSIFSRDLSDEQKEALKQMRHEYDFGHQYHTLQCIEERAIRNFRQNFLSHSM